MKFGLSLVVLLAATIVIPAANATRGWSPACGEVVTTNVTLTKSMKNCASGLVVGADNLTIDLNGYAIKGLADGTGVGIDVTGRTGVTVKNGNVTDFAEGVKLFNTSNSTVENLSSAGPSRASDWLARTRDRLERDSRQQGPRLGRRHRRLRRGLEPNRRQHPLRSHGHRHLLSRHVQQSRRDRGEPLVRNDVGIRLQFCGASVAENIASNNASAGIFRTRSNGRTFRNVANRNGGIGINVDDSPGLVSGNVTLGNTSHGLAIVDQIRRTAPSTRSPSTSRTGTAGSGSLRTSSASSTAAATARGTTAIRRSARGSSAGRPKAESRIQAELTLGSLVRADGRA